MSAKNAKVPHHFPISARDKLPKMAKSIMAKSITSSLQGVSCRPSESKSGWPPLVPRLQHLPLLPLSTQSKTLARPRGERRILRKLKSLSKPKKKSHQQRKQKQKKLRRRP